MYFFRYIIGIEVNIVLVENIEVVILSFRWFLSFFVKWEYLWILKFLL